MLSLQRKVEIAERFRRNFEGKIYSEVPEKDIHLELGDDEGSYYDSSREVIHLGLSFFEAKDEKDLLKQANYILGHEIQHVKSTASDPWEKGIREGIRRVLIAIGEEVGYEHSIITPRDQDRFVKYLEEECDIYISLRAIGSLVHHIINSVEDGRIERIRSAKKIGFHRYRVYFRVEKMWKPRVITADEASDPGERLNIVLNQILSLSTLERYQRGYVTNFFGGAFHKKYVRPILPFIKEGICAQTTALMAEASIQIVEHIAFMIAEAAKQEGAFENLIKAILAQIPENLENAKPSASENSEEQMEEGEESRQVTGDSDLSENEEEQDENESASGNGEENEEGKDQKGKGSESEDNKDKKDDKKEAGDEANEGNESNTPNSKPSKPSTSDNGPKELSDSEIERSIKEIEKQLDELTGKEQEKAKREEKQEAERQEKLKGEPTRKVNAPKRVASRYPNIKFKYIEKRIVPDLPLPPREAAEGEAFRKEIEEMLPDDKVRIIGNSGSVSSRTILNLAMGKTDLAFEMTKKEDEKDAPAFFCLIDNSGSMWNGPGSLRWKAASAMAVVEEGVREHAPIRIESFTANGTNLVVHEIIKDFDDVSAGNFSYNWMQKSNCAAGNKDGWSIRMAATTLAERQEEEKVLFVFSDGYPTAYEYGMNEGINDVYDAVAEAREMGLHVIGIFMYEGELDDGFKEGYRKMYGNDIVFAKGSDIRPEITRLVRSFF